MRCYTYLLNDEFLAKPSTESHLVPQIRIFVRLDAHRFYFHLCGERHDVHCAHPSFDADALRNGLDLCDGCVCACVAASGSARAAITQSLTDRT
jgi:hypothetical protein